MKKLLILALVLLTSVAINAQKEGKPKFDSQKALSAKSHHLKLCQLKAYASDDGKMKVLVDFGDSSMLNQNQIKEMKTEGYSKSFNNIVDALRYMRKMSWRMVETYSLTEEKREVIYFIMSRK